MTTVAPVPDHYKEGFEVEEDISDNEGYTPSPLPKTGNEKPPVPESVVYSEPDLTSSALENILIEIPLHQCARNGYTEEVRTLLKDPQVLADINNVDEEHQAALHYAARYNHYEIVRLLIENKADVNIEDDEGLTPLHYACRISRKRKRKSKSRLDLFENNDSPGTSPLRKRMDPEAACIHYLISNGASIKQGDDYKQTPLHHAALRGDEVACEQLLIYQTPELMLVNIKDMQDMTPLHTAVCQSHVEIVKMLIKAGADLRSRDEELSTPLHEAAAVDGEKTVKLILNACKKEVSGSTEQELLDDKV